MRIFVCDTMLTRCFVHTGHFAKAVNRWDQPSPNTLLPFKGEKNGAESLTEDDLLLASPILYGFSLSDKLWRRCSAFSASTFSDAHCS